MAPDFRVYYADFFVVDFLAAGFLVDLAAVLAFVVVFFAAVAFFAVLAFFAAGFVADLAVVFADFAEAVGLMPAAFAIFARAALRREAVFFLIRPFLAALSYSD